VLAAAYFQKLADERAVPLRAVAAGTDPDPALAPAAVELLRADGLPLPEDAPRHVTPADLHAAMRVISLGCDPADLPATPIALERWDDVPPVSVKPAAARDAIHRRVERLLDELQA
jgi:protein-tyrosine-phosphatase